MKVERLQEFATQAKWYHTMELKEGIRTAGVFDLEPYVARYGFPPSLSDWSALDVGTSNGYFAFEFERRGAAEVLAVDTNRFDGSIGTDVSPAHWKSYEKKYEGMHEPSQSFADVYKELGVPVGHQFKVVKALRQSQVAYRDLSVYDLKTLGRKFDLVFCGDLIEHLKHPLLALENLAAVTNKMCVVGLSNVVPEPKLGGLSRLILSHVFNIHPARLLEYVGNESGGSFFRFYPETFRQALLASGFTRVELVATFRLPHRQYGTRTPHAVYHCYP